jgi:hypothetical protein
MLFVLVFFGWYLFSGACRSLGFEEEEEDEIGTGGGLETDDAYADLCTRPRPASFANCA